MELGGWVDLKRKLDDSLRSDEAAELDMDGQGGRTFLRVLLNLVMANYPTLVSGALQLLFRHFSQRKEVLQAFTQVRGREGGGEGEGGREGHG